MTIGNPLYGVLALIVIAAIVGIVAGLLYMTRDSNPQVRASLSGIGLGDSARSVGTFGTMILAVAAFFGLIRIVLFMIGYG